jgi:hypothetical protein
MGGGSSVAARPENKNRVGLPSTDPAIAPKLSTKAKLIIQRFKDVSDDHIDIMTLRGNDFVHLISGMIFLQDHYRDMHVKVPLETVLRQYDEALKKENNSSDTIDPQVYALIQAYYTKDVNKPAPMPSNVPSISSYMPSTPSFSSFFKS